MQTVSERFWSKVERGHPDVCWEWKASLNPTGYGQFRYPGRNGMSKAHRVAALLCGKIQELKATRETFVLHTCHNRKCVNPDHLYIGTQRDNMHDMIKAGRAGFIKSGEDNYASIYTDKQIAEVFNLRGLRCSQQEIADKTGVSVRYVSDILCGKSRKDQTKEVDNTPVRSEHHNSKHPEWLKAAVLNLYADGVNCSAIARQLEVKKSFVFSLVKRYTS